MNQGKAREFVWEFQGNLGLNFDLCRESMALESGNTGDNSIRRFLTCSACLLMIASECVWALGEGSSFQLVRRPQKWHFEAEGTI